MSEGSALDWGGGGGGGKTGVEDGLGGPALGLCCDRCWRVRGRGLVRANQVRSLRNDGAVIGRAGAGGAVAVVSALAVGGGLQLVACKRRRRSRRQRRRGFSFISCAGGGNTAPSCGLKEQVTFLLSQSTLILISLLATHFPLEKYHEQAPSV